MKISDYALCRSLTDIKYYISLKMLESPVLILYFYMGLLVSKQKKKKKYFKYFLTYSACSAVNLILVLILAKVTLPLYSGIPQGRYCIALCT